MDYREGIRRVVREEIMLMEGDVVDRNFFIEYGRVPDDNGYYKEGLTFIDAKVGGERLFDILRSSNMLGKTVNYIGVSSHTNNIFIIVYVNDMFLSKVKRSDFASSVNYRSWVSAAKKYMVTNAPVSSLWVGHQRMVYGW